MCVHIRPCGFALDPAAPATNASLLSFNSLSYWFSEWLDWRYTLPNYLFSEGSFERTYVSEHWAYVAHNTFEPLISCLVILFHSDCIACQRLNRRTVHISSFLGKRMSPEIEMNSLLLYTLCTHSAPLLVWMPESLQEEYCFAEVISENRTRRRITNFNDWALFSEIQIRKERTYLRIFSGDG